jgi:hypothetical protein
MTIYTDYSVNNYAVIYVKNLTGDFNETIGSFTSKTFCLMRYLAKSNASKLSLDKSYYVWKIMPMTDYELFNINKSLGGFFICFKALLNVNLANIPAHSKQWVYEYDNYIIILVSVLIIRIIHWYSVI